MGIRVLLVNDVDKRQNSLADLLTTLGDFRVIGSATTEAEAN
jgi:DNA-binding NarL/FixJ family response regulator